MATLGIKSEITSATTKDRTLLSSFYKSMSVDSLRLLTPVSINAAEEYEVDLSSSKAFVVIAEDYALENSVLNITFTDSSNNTFTIEGVGFIQLNFENLVKAVVRNTYTEAISVNLIY